jgi:hypothetical protein
MNETRKRGSILRKETGFQVGNRIVLPTPEPEQQPAGKPLDAAALVATRHKVFDLIRQPEHATASEFEQLARELRSELVQIGLPKSVMTGALGIIHNKFRKVQELTRKTDLKAAVKAAQALGRPASKPDEPPTVQPDAGAATADRFVMRDHAIFDTKEDAFIGAGDACYLLNQTQPTSGKQEPLMDALIEIRNKISPMGGWPTELIDNALTQWNERNK